MTVTEIENRINAKLEKKGYVLAEGVAEQIYNETKEDVQETDALVDKLLQSVGQSLFKNQKTLKNKKALFFEREDEALKLLRKIDKEVV